MAHPNTSVAGNDSSNTQHLRPLVTPIDFAECSRILVGPPGARKSALVTAVDWPLVYYQYEHQPPREIVWGGAVEDLDLSGLGPIKHRNVVARSSRGMFHREMSKMEAQQLFGAAQTTGPFRLRRGFSIGMEIADQENSQRRDEEQENNVDHYEDAREHAEGEEQEQEQQDENECEDEYDDSSFVGIFNQMHLAHSRLIQGDHTSDREVLAEKNIYSSDENKKLSREEEGGDNMEHCPMDSVWVDGCHTRSRRFLHCPPSPNCVDEDGADEYDGEWTKLRENMKIPNQPAFS